VQGTGLGKKLLDLALDYLEAKGRPIWLGVWQGNLKAQHVYQGRGFAIAGEYKFRVGDWYDDEFIMRRG
jgi:ribosomal protein S18 acetylase RimI-like enzyme